jgi:hypothetical protein
MQVKADGLRRVCSLLEAVRMGVSGDAYWPTHLDRLLVNLDYNISIHVAVFQSPYVERLLDGSKTVESRFASVRCAPYHRVERGDVVLVKRSGGPIVALFQAGETWNFRLTSRTLQAIRERFGQAIAPASEEFWHEHEAATYATLIEVEHVLRIEPVPWVKTDRRGWVVLQSRRDMSPRLFE